MKVAILGGGSWGTALAILTARAGNSTTLWLRNPQQAATLQQERTNARYLPDVPIPEEITITSDIAESTEADCYLYAVPAQQLRQFIRTHHAAINPQAPFILCSKGIDIASAIPLPHVPAQENMPNPIGVLSGPTFAKDAARGCPTTATLALPDNPSTDLAAPKLAAMLSSTTFLCVPSRDVLGVSLAGALKNIVAILTGCAMGLELGDNTVAGLITMGLGDIMELGRYFGCSPDTFHGPAGIGDLLMTATSTTSRNTRYGMALATQQLAHGDRRAGSPTDPSLLSEGVLTSQALDRLFATHPDLPPLPLLSAVSEILQQEKPIEPMIRGLFEQQQSER